MSCIFHMSQEAENTQSCVTPPTVTPHKDGKNYTARLLTGAARYLHQLVYLELDMMYVLLLHGSIFEGLDVEFKLEGKPLVLYYFYDKDEEVVLTRGEAV